jgi:putative PIN family toxin of toxin-antitoxin system
LRAVVDTNVWVSALINPSGAPARVLAHLRSAHFRLVISEPLLTELADVLARPRLIRKYALTPERSGAILAVLRSDADLVSVESIPQRCRDPKDDVVIETAAMGRADVLVSRDADFTRAKELIEHLAGAGIRILTVRGFLLELEGVNGG